MLWNGSLDDSVEQSPKRIEESEDERAVKERDKDPNYIILFWKSFSYIVRNL